MLYLWLPVWFDICIINVLRSRGKIISRGVFPKVKNFVVCAKFPMGPKFHFSQWKTYFTKLIEKFLKFEEMKYLYHHIKFKMWLALCKSSILFSAVKLKLWYKFSQFIYRFRIGTFESWTKFLAISREI